MAPDTRTDDKLLAELCTGNADAFGELYRRYRIPLYAFCIRMARDQDRAGDLLHDVFLTLYRSAATIREPGALKIWLFRVARNQVLMSTRAAVEIHNSEFECAGDGETPETLLESAERSEILRHALSSLKAEYREVLLLREEEGMSYADIARVTGDSESSVKSRLFKARRALAAMLSPRLGERSLR